MNRMLILAVGLIGIQLVAEYTHTIRIDNLVKNTPGTYEFMLNNPAYRFTLNIGPDQKLSIATRHNTEVTIVPEGLHFMIEDCLTKITLNVTAGKHKDRNFEITPALIHRSAFGPSSCTSYIFGMSMDTQGKLKFRELPQ